MKTISASRPTRSDMMQLFGLNMLQKAESPVPATSGIITMVNFNTYRVEITIGNNKYERHPDIVTLLKKSLLAISDEDAELVAKMEGAKVNHAAAGKRMVERFLRDWRHWSRLTLPTIDELRELGYATPFKHFSIEDLEREKLIRIIDK